MNFAYLIEPPFNYRNPDGTVTGCDVELARTILKMVGIHDLKMLETEFAQLLPGLADSRWRMTTGLFATEERRKVAAFSRPIWALPDGLLVRNGNPMRLTGYRSVATTEGCVLAVIRDQIQHRSAIAFMCRMIVSLFSRPMPMRPGQWRRGAPMPMRALQGRTAVSLKGIRMRGWRSWL